MQPIALGRLANQPGTSLMHTKVAAVILGARAWYEPRTAQPSSDFFQDF